MSFDFEASHGFAVFTGESERSCEGLRLHVETGDPLLISGVHEDVKLHELFAACNVDMRDVDPEQVKLDYGAQDTMQNAENTLAWAEGQNIEALTIITSDYHMERALLELRCKAPKGLIIKGVEVATHLSDETRVFVEDAEFKKRIWRRMTCNFS